MAEVVGVISGAITIAQVAMSIGKVVIRLNRQWSMVKDIPADILDLMRQIECLYPTFVETETIFSKDISASASHQLMLQRAVIYCHQALDHLNDLAKELDTAISTVKNRRTLLRLKILLKKDLLERLERRLERAVRTLTLIHAGYTVTIRLPEWLCKISWELRCSKAMGAWTYVLHSYNIRPHDSEVFEIAKFGSSSNLVSLFTDGLASPYDVSDDGSTLIHVSSRSGINL
ncbi:hypothetical protein F4777DRAFT_601819 [Nemania sp. FL0916]|nr:hypothetical protein F4777DRAFT_601819 [Nemania sp. FL0916]